ncbi:hypothetical protein ACOYAW_00030, partial [Enterococcus faecalis]
MIEVRGLSDDVYELMLANAQNRIIQSIRTAAANGNTSCVVNSKGLTSTFLSQLETEGFDHVELEENKT